MSPQQNLPPRGGVGLKPCHYGEILASKPSVGFFEVHAENYMGAGGPPHRYLSAIRADYPLSIHGVGLSLAGAEPLDHAHLERLADLVARYQPQAVSEHLAWSSHAGAFLDDLLPIPYTNEALSVVCEHIDAAQNAIGRPILLENPSTYVAFDEGAYDEPTFLAEVIRRTGCGLLLDVSNVYVSCTNHGRDMRAYFDGFPLHAVGEIHLAGFSPREDAAGRPLLIDSHDRAVAEPVWQVYASIIDRLGPTPTLIERDADIPAWAVLCSEAQRADTILAQYRSEPGDVIAA